MNKNVFLSYATGSFIPQRDALCTSAQQPGYDQIISLTDSDIKHTDFWKKNQHILQQPRGAGYWLWKPFIIKQELSKLNEGDVLTYCDAGRSNYYLLEALPKNLIHKTRNNEQGFLLGPALFQHGALKKWTKRDCLLLMDCDSESITEKPLIQATWSFWTPSKEAFEFLDQWMKYSLDERCLTDLGNTMGVANYDSFIDHRHDQSILTLLAYKAKSDHLDFSHTKSFKILALRPQSQLSHLFLKRIDDAENLVSKKTIFKVIIKSFLRLKNIK